MKKFTLLFIAIIYGCTAWAQSGSASTATPTSTAISDLVVPVSPAFSITDITPTLVQNPGTPKAFALGIVESVSQSGSAFPNNYSAEFAPIWWIDPKGINVYSYLGLPVPKKNMPASTKENVFAGIKFTTVSIAFINKDLIPDTSSKTQSIFSIGIHTTLVKVYGADHAKKLAGLLDRWEKSALGELKSSHNDSLRRLMTRLDPSDTAYKTKIAALQKQYIEDQTPVNLQAINQLLAQKPYFAWDMSAALAEYGVNNQSVQTGRAGVWTSLSSNIPLGKDSTNYFNMNLLGRYLFDNFQQNAQGITGRANNIDIGGNLGFAFSKLSIAVESLYRFVNGQPNTENRTVGIISVKLTDKLYVNGTFGKDFAGPNKLISVFGINWGLGNEKVALP